MSRYIKFLLIILLLSACRLPKRALAPDTLVPQHIFCEDRIAWSAEAMTDEGINYASFWIAFDNATVQDNFKYVRVEVTLDGKSVADEMKYRGAPHPYPVTCTDGGLQFKGSRVKYILFLPPLSNGEHKIVWKYIFIKDLSDGWFDYPKGMTREITSTLIKK